MLLSALALLAASLFTGAAFYVSAVEQPARLKLDDRALLTEWQPAYHRGAIMQASLAMIGGALGVTAWWQTKSDVYLAGALALLLNWPYTLIIMLPLNNILYDTAPENAGPASRTLIEKWGRLHAVRTGLGALATALFLAAQI